ncbi:MAG: exopolysaccharide biosynthesis protein [Gemmatimonadota bacterium]
MNESSEPSTLDGVLDRIDPADSEPDQISVGDILEVLGPRSFGPFLLVAGLVTLAPLVGDIPGVPTIIGVIVFLISVQLLVGRETFWLPGVLLRRSVAADKMRRAVGWMRRPAQFLDRFLRRRLAWLTAGRMIRMVAAACLMIAVAMPFMEVVPFSANVAGAALSGFGLALVTRDGVALLIAFGFTFGVAGVLGFAFF